MTIRCRIAAAAVLAVAGCAGLGPGAQEPEIENQMADGSPCVTLAVRLVCINSTVEGQCTVTVQNRSPQAAIVHDAFIVGDEHDASKWRNLYFRVVDIKGYAWRMNARFMPAHEVGVTTARLPSLADARVTYDVALLHHRVSRTGRAVPLTFGRYTVSAHYDVSQIIAPQLRPYCKPVFASNKVNVEILGPSGVMSPAGRYNPFDRSPHGLLPHGGSEFTDPVYR